MEAEIKSLFSPFPPVLVRVRRRDWPVQRRGRGELRAVITVILAPAGAAPGVQPAYEDNLAHFISGFARRVRDKPIRTVLSGWDAKDATHDAAAATSTIERAADQSSHSRNC